MLSFSLPLFIHFNSPKGEKNFYVYGKEVQATIQDIFIHNYLHKIYHKGH